VTTSVRTTSVYLPAGRWIDLFSGRTVAGRRAVRRATPLRTFPLYLRAGTTIPFNLREARLWRRRWPLNALRLSRRAGWLSGASTVELTKAPPESEVLFPRRTRPAAVTVDGRRVRGFSSASELRSARTGWIWNASPFPGVLVKVRPLAGRARITVS